MIRVLARRLLSALLLLWGVSLICFLLFELSPGDYFVEARLSSPMSQEAVSALRHQYGLDRPVPIKYLEWMKSVFRGEYGISLAYGVPAGPIVFERARNTLLLTTTATAMSWLLAIPLAVHCAARRGPLQAFVRGCLSFLNSTPDILIALGLLVIAARTGLFPIGGMTSATANVSDARDIASHLVLPVFALVLGSLPAIVTHAIAGVSETLNSTFILAARAHGIPRLQLLYVHALPASANVLVTLFGLSAGTLLSSSLLVEAAMGWPGLGALLLQATLQRDAHVVIGAVMLSSLFLIAGNVLADLCLYALDPRAGDA